MVRIMFEKYQSDEGVITPLALQAIYYDSGMYLTIGDVLLSMKKADVGGMEGHLEYDEFMVRACVLFVIPSFLTYLLTFFLPSFLRVDYVNFIFSILFFFFFYVCFFYYNDHYYF